MTSTRLIKGLINKHYKITVQIITLIHFFSQTAIKSYSVNPLPTLFTSFMQRMQIPFQYVEKNIVSTHVIS
jgi:hypothetical protein